MKLSFLGASRQVTGSRYCLETEGVRILIDCGMFQERALLERNWAPSPVPPDSIHALLLTHVHIDHIGLVPKLVREGFQGPIYCTRPTAAMSSVMLLDAARIQTEDANYKRRRHRKEGRQGPHPEVPLYTEEDAERVQPLLRPVAYATAHPVHERIQATFFDAGHILGSAMIQLDVRDGDQQTRIVFSGDIGQWNKPLVRDPTLLSSADYLIMESTYGDRNHIDGGDIPDQLAEVITSTYERGGNVVIPTFAVERAQELMYHIGGLVHQNRIPDLPIYLDSPMAVDITEIFQKFPDCYDAETWERIVASQPPLHFPGLRMCRTVEQSKRINATRRPCVIMSTAGMCNAGRIKHHLRQNIEREECTILFVGFQAEGTLGRRIIDGERRVRIHNREYRVRAKIAQLHGFSAHADQDDLLRWAGNFEGPRRVFLTHGEPQASKVLAGLIESRFGWPVSVPDYGDQYELAGRGTGGASSQTVG